MWLTWHPRWSTLNRFADGELSSWERRRVTDHLARCESCRTEVHEVRALARAARELDRPEPDPRVIHDVLERRERGDRIILPAVAGAGTTGGRSHWWIRAVAVVVLLVSGVTTVNSVRARSELVISPRQPQAGSSVVVRYRPAWHAQPIGPLVLRARFRRTGETALGRATPEITIGSLRPEGTDVFTTTMRLPDSVVYAVFAVEEASGRRLDNGVTMWELLVFEGDRPMYEALVQKQRDLLPRDPSRARETARRAVELYPSHPDALMRLEALDRALRPRVGPGVYANLPLLAR